MARMHPPRLEGAAATVDAAVFDRLAGDFDDDWQIFADPTIRARGEEGRVDFVLVNPRLGVALVGLFEDGEAEASAEEAAAAMREMLREAGFEDRFIGRLPIVALTLRPERAGELRRRIAEGFARQPALSIPGTAWAEFVAEQLDPARAVPPLTARIEGVPPRGELRLQPPSREDAWRVSSGARAAGAPIAPAPVALALDGGRVAPSADGARSYLWPALGLALCVVVGILVGMAVMQHGSTTAPQQQAVSKSF